MSSLINIAKDDTKPVYVDVSEITSFAYDPSRTEMSIYNTKGQLMYINYESFNIDPADLLEKLTQAGNKMLYFPTRYEDKEHQQYVSPAAVTFATLTEIGKDNEQGAIVGIRGYGRIETYKAKPEEVEALLKAAAESGIELQKYTPDVVHSRWYNASALYIDPKAVTQIKDTGYGQIDVSFRDSGSLDIQAGRDSSKRNQAVADIANRLWNANRDAYPTLNDVFKAAENEVKAAEDKLREDFITKITSNNATLVKVPGTQYALYLTPEKYAYIGFHDFERDGKTSYSMTLSRQKTPANQYLESINLYFNSAAARKTAFETIRKAVEKPAKGQAKRQKASAKPRP